MFAFYKDLSAKQSVGLLVVKNAVIIALCITIVNVLLS